MVIITRIPMILTHLQVTSHTMINLANIAIICGVTTISIRAINIRVNTGAQHSTRTVGNSATISPRITLGKPTARVNQIATTR